MAALASVPESPEVADPGCTTASLLRWQDQCTSSVPPQGTSGSASSTGVKRPITSAADHHLPEQSQPRAKLLKLAGVTTLDLNSRMPGSLLTSLPGFPLIARHPFLPPKASSCLQSNSTAEVPTRSLGDGSSSKYSAPQTAGLAGYGTGLARAGPDPASVSLPSPASLSHVGRKRGSVDRSLVATVLAASEIQYSPELGDETAPCAVTVVSRSPLGPTMRPQAGTGPARTPQSAGTRDSRRDNVPVPTDRGCVPAAPAPAPAAAQDRKRGSEQGLSLLPSSGCQRGGAATAAEVDALLQEEPAAVLCDESSEATQLILGRSTVNLLASALNIHPRATHKGGHAPFGAVPAAHRVASVPVRSSLPPQPAASFPQHCPRSTAARRILLSEQAAQSCSPALFVLNEVAKHKARADKLQAQVQRLCEVLAVTQEQLTVSMAANELLTKELEQLRSSSRENLGPEEQQEPLEEAVGDSRDATSSATASHILPTMLV